MKVIIQIFINKTQATEVHRTGRIEIDVPQKTYNSSLETSLICWRENNITTIFEFFWMFFVVRQNKPRALKLVLPVRLELCLWDVIEVFTKYQTPTSQPLPFLVVSFPSSSLYLPLPQSLQSIDTLLKRISFTWHHSTFSTFSYLLSFFPLFGQSHINFLISVFHGTPGICKFFLRHPHTWKLCDSDSNISTSLTRFSITFLWTCGLLFTIFIERCIFINFSKFRFQFPHFFHF